MFLLFINFVFGTQQQITQLVQVQGEPNTWKTNPPHEIVGFHAQHDDALRYVNILNNYTKLTGLVETKLANGLTYKWYAGETDKPSGGFFEYAGLRAFIYAPNQEALEKSYSLALNLFETTYNKVYRPTALVSIPAAAHANSLIVGIPPAPIPTAVTPQLPLPPTAAPAQQAATTTELSILHKCAVNELKEAIKTQLAHKNPEIITVLNFSQNTLADWTDATLAPDKEDIVKLLTQTLPKMTALTSINLENLNLGDDAMKQIIDALPISTLEDINFAKTGMEATASTDFANKLFQMENVKEINLTNTFSYNITKEIIQMINTDLSKKFTTLKLGEIQPPLMLRQKKLIDELVQKIKQTLAGLTIEYT